MPSNAIDESTETVRRNPTSPAAHFHLGRALQEAGRLAAAIAAYRESLRLNPASAAAHNNLGDTLLQLGQWDDAEQMLRQTLRLKADFPEAHNNLGVVLARGGRLDEAEWHHRQALQLNPASAAAYNNLGNVLREQGKFTEGLAYIEHALRLRPDDAEAHRNRAMTLLLLGDWQQGWREYEWRLRCRDARPPEPIPRWDGSPLAGRTILLRSEQGYGDSLQHIRFAPLVKERGGRVVVACPAPLARLFSTAHGIDQVLTAASAADVWAPLPSLPGIFGATPARMPGRVPYLFADPALVAAWRELWASLRGFKIGIVWQGNPQLAGDRWRSVPLSTFAPIADLKGIHLFSLQMEAGREQLPPLAERFGLLDLSDSISDFMDTAAVMMNLDLVIATDTAVAHLAGALGVPVWVALPWPPEGRWLLEREDTPWYPSMRLFRQTARCDWASVFTRIAAAADGYFGLSKILSSKRL